MTAPVEILELFSALESNNPQEVKDVKHRFHEQFNITREPWLLNGMFDYFLSTKSSRAIEVLVAIREPHDKFLFDKLNEVIKGTDRIHALTLLGHVIKRQPTWLIKITNHNLIKELLKILKYEEEIVIITSGIVVLNVLLTVIPALIASILPEIFGGFSRLAAWNVSLRNGPEIYSFHLQISLFTLFAQLYSMFPCSFYSFMRQEYNSPENRVIYTHTIKPMLETMRMHPGLIVGSIEEETSSQRWKKMEQHDVVMECTKYILIEYGDRTYQNFQMYTESSYLSALDKLKSSIGVTIEDMVSVNSVFSNELWSPTLHCGTFSNNAIKSVPTTPNVQAYHKTSVYNHNHNENSPPEAAVEATPETTPIRDFSYQQMKLPPINSTVVRALNSFGLDNLSRRNSTTPNSQPSSPLKKEGFVFPSEDIQSQALVRRMDRMMLERNQVIDTNKDENNVRSESKPITAQTQPLNNPEIIHIEDEDMIECDQQSNGSPCQSHEGGMHMPNSASLKEFMISVRKRTRYHSQCTPERTISVTGQSTGSSPRKSSEFSLLNVRRANSCPEIKKTNGNSASSSTSPLQEESEEDHGDKINISNGHHIKIPKLYDKRNNHIINVQNVSTQTEYVLPYEHLFYCLFPAYNDSHNSQSNIPNSDKDESISLIENIVKTSSIVHKHRMMAESCNDIEEAKLQIILLTLMLQFERNRREVHAERNRRLLGKSRSSRALDEQNITLRDQIKTLNKELSIIKTDFEMTRQKALNEIKELKENVSHWRTECLKYQEETKEAKINCQALEQLRNGERIKTAEVTKELSETKAELFNTLSELSIVQATADISTQLKKTVTMLQRELVMCGEMQTRQYEVVSNMNAIKTDASNAMLSQESLRHHLNELQDMVHYKSSQLETSEARIADLELKLKKKNAYIQKEKREMELVKEQYHKQLSEAKEECRILREMQCRNHESRLEEESKAEFIHGLPKFNSDIDTVVSNFSISKEGADFRLNMMLANCEDSDDELKTTT